MPSSRLCRHPPCRNTDMRAVEARQHTICHGIRGCESDAGLRPTRKWGAAKRRKVSRAGPVRQGAPTGTTIFAGSVKSGDFGKGPLYLLDNVRDI